MWNGGYWNQQALKGQVARRLLRDCNIEEISAHYRIQETPSLLFDAGRANKRIARDKVVELFGTERYPDPIRVLTMPGLKWKFEGPLLRQREGVVKFGSGPGPTRTTIHAVENDRATYYAALMRVPGIGNPRNVIVDHGRSAHAERTLGYLWVDRYSFANVDDVIALGEDYDCVWLDYFGPLTLERLALIKSFFERHVHGSLVVTSLKNRWNPAVSSALRRFASYETWIRHEFRGAEFEHYLEYQDTSHMVQFAVSRRNTQGSRASTLPAHPPRRET